MKDTDFKKISEQLKKRSNRLISQATLARVAGSASFLEAAAMLTQNTEYDFSNVSTLEQVNKVLDQGIEALYQEVYQLTPHASVVDVLSSRYDFSNLKQAIIASFSEDLPLHYTLASPIAKEEFDAFADLQNDLFDSRLPSHLLNSGIEARALFEQSESQALTETFLDQKMFWWMLALADDMGNDFIITYVQTAIDIYNISTLLLQRMVQRQRSFVEPFLIDGGRTPIPQISAQYARSASAVVPVYYHKHVGDVLRYRLSEWEKKGDSRQIKNILRQLLFATTENSQYVEYGAEVVFGYLLAREDEIETIRLLFTRKAAGSPPESIRTEVNNPFLSVGR